MDWKVNNGLCTHFYRPKRSFGQGNIFTPVCHSVHREGSGKETPRLDGGTPRMEDPPNGDPPDGEPPRMEEPPLDGGIPPPGKRTPAYGPRSAGTHPTGMHSCSRLHGLKNSHDSSRLINRMCEWTLTALFTKPQSTVLPAVGTTLKDRSLLTTSRHFLALYQAKQGTVLPATLLIALLILKQYDSIWDKNSTH